MQQSGMVEDRNIDTESGERDRFTYHGGDLGAARAAFPDAPAPWIDLSTGINPVPYPLPSLDPAAWTGLPDAGAARALEAAAARAYGAEAAGTVAAPGTEALIQWLPRLFPARRVGVLGFTYGDHARAWQATGATVETVDTLAALAGFDAAVVVNPNNPDGRLVAPADLAALARHVGLLVVDEAFADVVAPCLEPSRPRRRRTPSCCAPSASSTASRGCGSASRWHRRSAPRRCGRRSVPGR